jgi:hypothetical protein
MSTDHRSAAQARINDLIATLNQLPAPEAAPLVSECQALANAIAAFHMEAIRFRIYNVDRMIARGGGSLPPSASSLLEDARKHLEAAGFHTRSHQAPT